MLARVALSGPALLLAVGGLHLDVHQTPGARLGQAGQELTAGGEAVAAGETEADWPWSRKRDNEDKQRNEGKQRRAAPPKGRLAVLVSGSVERLLLTPLLSNVVSANARNGLQVDLFLGLRAPTNISQSPVEFETPLENSTSDPKISQLLQGVSASNFNSAVMDQICRLAQSQLASSCFWDLEEDNALPLPVDDEHRRMMTQAVAARWRSQSRLWKKALAQEQGRKYDAILAARGDDFWMAPSVVDISAFQTDPRKFSVMSCLESTGVTDEAVLMGREAAEKTLRLPVVMGVESVLMGGQAWQKPEPELEGARVAQNFWLHKAKSAGLNVVPEPKPVALASYTRSGLPCFRRQALNSSQKEVQVAEYQKCFGESSAAGPLTSLLGAFGCEDMNPAVYGLMWPQQVQQLHQKLAELAGRQERKPVVVTVIDDDELDLGFKMLRSLQAAGESANSLIVGTVPGICQDLDMLYGVAKKRCVIVQPALAVRRGIFKHAVLATAALAGLSDRIVYASPRVLFAKSPGSQLLRMASGKQIYFGTSDMTSTDADGCNNVSDGSIVSLSDSSPFVSHELDSSIVSLSDTPEVMNLLLRAWARMEENKDMSQDAAFASVVEEKAEGMNVALLPCGTARLQETDKAEPSESTILAALAPGARPPPRPVQPKAMRRSAEQASEEAEESDEPKSFKDMWKQRIQEMREEEGYNETEAREIAAEKRRAKRASKKEKPNKHVKYLPPEEAAAVKAKEEKWKAQQEKQKEEDLENKDSRRKAFEREVAKAQRVMEGLPPDSEESPPGGADDDDSDTGAA